MHVCTCYEINSCKTKDRVLRLLCSTHQKYCNSRWWGFVYFKHFLHRGEVENVGAAGKCGNGFKNAGLDDIVSAEQVPTSHYDLLKKKFNTIIFGQLDEDKDFGFIKLVWYRELFRFSIGPAPIAPQPDDIFQYWRFINHRKGGNCSLQSSCTATKDAYTSLRFETTGRPLLRPRALTALTWAAVTSGDRQRKGLK